MAVNFVEKIDDLVKIKNVLVSVSNKTGLDVLIPSLLRINPGITIYSTGGTYQALAELLGAKKTKNLRQVSDYTGQPEMQGGLVKTLDFKIYLGLLSETYNKAHAADLKRTQAVTMDMVVVNLYPFAQTIARPDATSEQARANIDIGGPCMVRAAAKNYLRVASVTDPRDYRLLLKELTHRRGKLAFKTRFELARKAFAHVARYDSAIAAYLARRKFETVRGVYQIMARK